jgi:hypothetical protein
MDQLHNISVPSEARVCVFSQRPLQRWFSACGDYELEDLVHEFDAADVLIGEHPETEVFQEHCDWPDAVIHVPFDTWDIAEILFELDSRPGRMEQTRKNNTVFNRSCVMTGPINGQLF